MGFLGRRLAARTLPPVTIRELRLALQKEWAAMPQQLIDTLILSMGRCYETCLALHCQSARKKRRAVIRFLFVEGVIPALDTSYPFHHETLNDDDPQWLTSIDCPIFRSHMKDKKENEKKQAFLLGVDRQWSCHVERHGSKWKSRRKLLTPSFHFEILKDFLPIFNEQSQVLVKQLRNEITKDSTDISMPITLCSLDIICETTLGVSIGAQENSDSQYIKSVSRSLTVYIKINLSQNVNFDVRCTFSGKLFFTGRELKHHLKVLHDFTRSVIKEKKKKLLSGEKNVNEKRKRKALMDVLLEHHIQMKDLTEEDIREEVDTFAFEGHDTTATGIYWALYNIGLNKDVQEKIHEELDRIFGDDTERPVNTEDLKDMVYLDRVIKESQRLYPSVPVIARRISENTNICGYPIPEGSSCIVFVHQLHRDETVFPNPEKFDPDHFLPENSANRHPYAYIPFSAGPRNCIGQRFAVMEEKKVLISAILRNYTIESLCHRDKLPPTVELTLRSSKPFSNE
ncbi:cytochrome P450 4V2 [Trichonephila clavipes]|nr:cytochrome P450 4V2 [Trichonephila clavipes]